MASAPEVQVISLTTTPANLAAMQMYTSMGFTVERTMAAFRKQIG
jgi:ribosomal protein S18 acetylase RimI-like enzyme